MATKSNPAQLAYRFLASNGLGTILILFLFLLTLFGTLEQSDRGIAEVQKQYFESLFLVSELLPFPLPLPGVYLLLILLTVNIVVGAIVNVRWRPAKIGVLITHIGMVLLFASGFFIYQGAERAELVLDQGQMSAEALAESDWEVALFPVDPGARYTEHLIPEEDFGHLGEGETRRFHSEDLPFDLVLSRFWKEPDGSLAKLDASVVVPDSDNIQERSLTGGRGSPPQVQAGGRFWYVWLRRARVELPFTMRLDRFRATFHPGTRTPKDFRSAVTLFDEKGERIQGAEIYMNHPLRRSGFTFYQSRYQGNTSIFEVVQNKADQFPLYATIIISIGLLIHFIRKLVRHLSMQAAGRS